MIGLAIGGAARRDNAVVAIGAALRDDGVRVVQKVGQRHDRIARLGMIPDNTAHFTARHVYFARRDANGLQNRADAPC